MTEETGKIIISLLVILLLILFTSYIIKIFRTNNEYEQARTTLSDLVSEIKNLENEKSTTFLIESPKGWSIINYIENLKRVCMCPTSAIRKKIAENAIENCNQKGLICENFNFPVKVQNQYETNKIDIAVVPETVNLYKKGDSVTIFQSNMYIIPETELNSLSHFSVKDINGEKSEFYLELAKVFEDNRYKGEIEDIVSDVTASLNQEYGYNRWCITYKKSNIDSWEYLNDGGYKLLLWGFGQNFLDNPDETKAKIGFAEKTMSYDNGEIVIHLWLLNKQPEQK